MKIYKSDDNTLIVKFISKMDVTETKQCEMAIIKAAAESTNIIFDLSETTYISSEFIHLCMEVYLIMNRKLMVVNMAPFVKKVFDITGLMNGFYKCAS